MALHESGLPADFLPEIQKTLSKQVIHIVPGRAA